MARMKPPSKRKKAVAQLSADRDPATGRFGPGQSGNPHGRPPKAKTVDAAIARAFAAKASINVNGKPRKITKMDITATQLANRSAAGDRHLMKLGFEMVRKAEESSAQVAQGTAKLSESDQQIADRLLARWRKIIEENSK